MRTATILLCALVLAACATFKNTPQQDYVFAMGKTCETAHARFSVAWVATDGSQWRTNTADSGYELQAFMQCMREQFRATPLLDWLKTQPGARPGTLVASPGSGVGSEVQLSTTVPTWRIGDEWQYAYKSPSDSGSYVWVVDRTETWGGEQHYVIKTGAREIFYRVSDLASSIERVDGVIVAQFTPSRTNFAWPLAVGKVWEQSYRDERPVARSTTNRDAVWKVEGEETVTVLAGTFRTFKVTFSNKNTGAPFYEMWVAPEAKQWVKIREFMTTGVRERELISFKLAKP